MIEISFGQTGIDEVVARVSRVEVFLRDPITECKAELTQWFRDVEARAFTSQGGTTQGGAWRQLSPLYRRAKERKFPGRTILERTGRLRASLQVQTSDSIVQSTPRRLLLGTKVPYAGYNQATRPFINITNRDAAAAAVIVRRKLAGALGQQVGVAA